MRIDVYRIDRHIVIVFTGVDRTATERIHIRAKNFYHAKSGVYVECHSGYVPAFGDNGNRIQFDINSIGGICRRSFDSIEDAKWQAVRCVSALEEFFKHNGITVGGVQVGKIGKPCTLVATTEPVSEAGA